MSVFSFAAALLILPVAVVGQYVDSLAGFDELEREFENLAYGDHRARPHHRHRHFRHHHPHFRHHKSASLFADGPAATITVPAPSEGLLPGRHPAIAQKLGHMEQAMRDLAGRQRVAKIARDNLEDNVQNAVLHMNDAVSIKRELARTEAQLRAEEVKLKKLEDDRLRLDRTHGHLVSSLHHIMEPKIQFAETHLKQKQRALRNLESKASQWKEKEAEYHEKSLAMLEARRETKKKLEDATEAVNKARLEQEAAKKQLQEVKHNVAFNVQSYKYALTRAQAAASLQQRGEEVVKDAEHSLKRLSGILNMEQRRVDESMAIGKDRVQGKVRELEGVEEKSKAKLGKLTKEYSEWQMQQRLWARRVASTQEVSHETSRDYAERQQAVLDAANAKVAYDAESDSDWAWDEWPTANRRDTDDVQLGAI